MQIKESVYKVQNRYSKSSKDDTIILDSPLSPKILFFRAPQTLFMPIFKEKAQFE